MSTEISSNSASLPVAMVPVEDDLETIQTALREVAEARARNIQEGQRLDARYSELSSGARELRRKQARNELDAFLPPIKINYDDFDYAETGGHD